MGELELAPEAARPLFGSLLAASRVDVLLTWRGLAYFYSIERVDPVTATGRTDTGETVPSQDPEMARVLDDLLIALSRSSRPMARPTGAYDGTPTYGAIFRAGTDEPRTHLHVVLQYRSEPVDYGPEVSETLERLKRLNPPTRRARPFEEWAYWLNDAGPILWTEFR